MAGKNYLTLLHLIFLSFLFTVSAVNTTMNGQPAERYELCKSTKEIQALQQQYELILVSSVPTKAAFMPSWPGKLVGLIQAVWAIIATTSPSNSGGRPWYKVAKNISVIALTYILVISWTIAFARIEVDKATGGWLPMLNGFNLIFSLMALADSVPKDGAYVLLPLMPFVLLQVCGGLAVVMQRWGETIGSIAYSITDLNGCTPFNGTTYLQQGARSRAFRIIQICEMVFVDLSFTSAFRFVASDDLSELKSVWSALLLILYLPEIIYESIIAGKGTPVVISGNCMLVELNPKWGFLDSEISNWWKALELIAGL